MAVKMASAEASVSPPSIEASSVVIVPAAAVEPVMVISADMCAWMWQK